eukprot:Partr_v1_DN22933_c0_g1_i1_m42581
MHTSGFAHCDIKPDNILMDMDSNTHVPYCVLTDFGIARVLDGKVLQVAEVRVANQAGLSIAYAAPETLKNYRSRTSGRFYHGDIYSLGIVILEILTGRSTYQD